jgi:endonuclease G, mitochondrial
LRRVGSLAKSLGALLRGETQAMGTIQPLLLQAIESTLARASNLDLARALASRNATPQDVAPAHQLRQRNDFLRNYLAGELSSSEIDQTFERIISGNELQDINYLEKGTAASRAVCRIRFEAMGGGYATGFLISPRVLITNNHVFPDAQTARTAEAQFRYERAVDGRELTAVRFKLEPDRLFFTSKALDFSVVAVRQHDVTNAEELGGFGFLPLHDTVGKAVEGEWLTIVQHPAGKLKQVCVRENQLLRRLDDFLWYSTDTLAGSSGSPVFSNDWLVVALHHSGVPERRNGVIQTVLGRDFDANVDKEDDIKWIANEGVRASLTVEKLREALLNPDLIKPIIAPPQPVASAGAVNVKPQEAAMSRSVTVQLEINDAGEVRLVGGSAAEALGGEASKPQGHTRRTRERDRRTSGPDIQGSPPQGV